MANNKTELIDVSKVQNGNMQLSIALHDANKSVETSIWYNTYIKDEILRTQVPVISHTTTDKSGKPVIVYFSDYHEYDGFNGLENGEGKFRIAYIDEDYGFDEYDTVDFETIEDVMKELV